MVVNLCKVLCANYFHFYMFYLNVEFSCDCKLTADISILLTLNLPPIIFYSIFTASAGLNLMAFRAGKIVVIIAVMNTNMVRLIKNLGSNCG